MKFTWKSQSEKWTAVLCAVVGTACMIYMFYAFYLISTTCGQPLIDGKCPTTTESTEQELQ